MERCVHEMLPGQCGSCRPPRRPPFLAAYETTCITCRRPIEVKQAIRETHDGEYEHAWHTH